jgi:hypothetical protein
MIRRGAWVSILFASVLCAAVSLAESPGMADESEIGRATDAVEESASGLLQIGELHIGFGKVYKVGFWTPLAVEIHSDHKHAVVGDVEFEVVDGDGLLTVVRETNVEIPANGVTTVRTLIKPGRPNGTITIRFRSAADTVVRLFSQEEVPPAILATQELFVEIGAPVGFDRLQKHYPNQSLERTQAALVLEPNSLPRRSLGYEGVDLVVLTTSDSNQLQAWSQQTDAVLALDQWVRHGGKLLFTVGRSGQQVLAEKSPLAGFAPGQFDRIVQRLPGPWETFANAVAESMEGAPMVTSTILRKPRGRVEWSDNELPLIVRSPHGLGEVLFVAADLDQPPFADWSARWKLLLRLLKRNELIPTQGVTAEDAQSVRLGYTDLAGQLRSALGQFSGARVVPFWLVFILALGYAALVFPVEFWVARWIRPRFEAAWMLLPSVLALGALGVWYIAADWKGERVLLKKAETVDVDLATGVIRGHSWIGMFSPDTGAYRLESEAAIDRLRPLSRSQLSWLGLPGAGLGGMNSQLASVDQFDRPYVFESDGGLKGVPLAAGSSKAFEATWQSSFSPAMDRLAESDDEHPLGRLVNNTGITLSDCMLFYAGWSYSLGSLQPGAVVDVGEVQRVLTVGSYLTGRRKTGDKEQTVAHDPEGADLRQIVRSMLFYRAAGGKQYTALSNRIYDRLDLTSQMRLDRAVVLATGPAATATSVQTAGEQAAELEEELTFYRFVIPVDREVPRAGDTPTAHLRLN